MCARARRHPVISGPQTLLVSKLRCGLWCCRSLRVSSKHCLLQLSHRRGVSIFTRVCVCVCTLHHQLLWFAVITYWMLNEKRPRGIQRRRFEPFCVMSFRQKQRIKACPGLASLQHSCGKEKNSKLTSTLHDEVNGFRSGHEGHSLSSAV